MHLNNSEIKSNVIAKFKQHSIKRNVVLGGV